MPRVFLSYRREDSSGYAGRVYDTLAAAFGESDVFMDVDTLQVGDDWVEHIERAVGQCDVLLALIGPRWAEVTDQRGRARLEDANDPVRLEIASALSGGIRVVPVLVQGAEVPDPEGLPEDIRALTRRHAHELTDTRWRYDSEKLLEALRRVAEPQRKPRGLSKPKTKAKPAKQPKPPKPPRTEPRLAFPKALRPRLGFLGAHRRAGVAAVVAVVLVAVGAILIGGSGGGKSGGGQGGGRPDLASETANIEQRLAELRQALAAQSSRACGYLARDPAGDCETAVGAPTFQCRRSVTGTPTVRFDGLTATRATVAVDDGSPFSMVRDNTEEPWKAGKSLADAVSPDLRLVCR